MKKLKENDWVKITKVGIDGAYKIVEITEEHVYKGARSPEAQIMYTCEQNDDGYIHRVKVMEQEMIRK